MERARRWCAADWHGFVINIPDVVAEMETALALAITRGADLGEANPDALALLLALRYGRHAPGRPRFPRGSDRDRAPPFRDTNKRGGRWLNEASELCSLDLSPRTVRS